MKKGVISGLITVLFLLSGCQPAADLSRCQPATPEQMDFINYAVGQMDSNNTVGPGWAVKSTEFENVYMVSAHIVGPGIEEGTDPAVWAVGGDPENPHTWLAVDGLAKSFTDLPDASKTDAQITLSSDGVELARQCVEENE